MIPDQRISTVSDLSRHSLGIRLVSFFSFSLFFLIVVVLNIYAFPMVLDKQKAAWFYLLLLPGVQMIIIIILGRYALSGILYPYQNTIVSQSLDRLNSLKFGEDFVHFLDCFLYTIKSNSGLHTERVLGS
jgi:hypothetical protein